MEFLAVRVRQPASHHLSNENHTIKKTKEWLMAIPVIVSGKRFVLSDIDWEFHGIQANSNIQVMQVVGRTRVQRDFIVLKHFRQIHQYAKEMN